MEPSKHSDRPQNGSFKTLKHSNSPQKWSLPKKTEPSEHSISPQKWSLPKKTEPSKQSNCPKINGAFPKKLSLQNNLIAPKMEPSKKKNGASKQFSSPPKWSPQYTSLCQLSTLHHKPTSAGWPHGESSNEAIHGL